MEEESEEIEAEVDCLRALRRINMYVIGTPADLQRTWKEETREERLEK